MTATKTTLAVVTAAVALLAAACSKAGGDSQALLVKTDPTAALSIVTAQPRADHADVAALVAGSAQTNEHVEIVTGSGRVLNSVSAPVPPVVHGPTPPPRLSANPTQFQVDAHNRQVNAYTTKLAADRRRLALLLESQLSAWAASATSVMTRAVDGPASGAEPGILAATAYFPSLQQAGLNLGPRRVLVIFGGPSAARDVPLLRPGSLTGITVIIANFQGSRRVQEEWQAGLMQAGAARAIVLVPAASGELAQVTSQGLAGLAGSAPAAVYFGLNRASLGPAARTVLRRVAVELTTTYPGAVVTILGFADPLGSKSRNALLATARALAAKSFLVGSGVAAARISAAGYGTDLPAAPSQADGAQPLDRRAVVIIDPIVP